MTHAVPIARSVYELYAKGHTYEEMHEQNRASRHLWEKYISDTSFKFVVNGYNHSISKARQRQVIEDFSYMGFLGTIDLLNPEVTLGCFEECGLKSPLEGVQHAALELMVF
jgi:tRNA (guanine10-N2)-methyltransferase